MKIRCSGCWLFSTAHSRLHTGISLIDQINVRAYACIVCAGSDGQGAVRQITTIATGWRLKQIQEPIIVNTAAQTTQQILAPKTLDQTELAKARDTGAAMASGLDLGIF